MNLGPRCNAMLLNGCQCPNTALTDSKHCGLHQNEHVTEQAQINDPVTPLVETNPDGLRKDIERG